MMVAENKRGFFFGWVVLFGVCVFMGLARGGINNAGGLFMVPVMAELGVGAGEFMLYFSVSSVVTFLFLPLAGKLMAKYDVRLLLVAGLVFQGGAFALFGFMSNIWGWYLLSIPLSIGSVFTTQIAGPVLIGSWFKKHNGLAIGIMMAAVGLFGAILQPLAGGLIAGQGWRNAYLALGAIVMAVGIPVVLLTIRSAPQGIPPSASEAAPTTNALPGVTAKEARKSGAFYALILFVFFATAVGCFGQHIPKYADQMGFDTAFAGGSMGFFMIGTLIGALVFGLLSDRIGAKITALFAMVVGVVAVLMAIFLGTSPLFFRIAFTLYGFMSASIGTLGPLLTTALFGQKDYGVIYSTVAMGMAFAGIIALPGYGFIYDAAESYRPVLWMISILLVACIICIVLAFAGKKKMERDGLWH